VRYLRATDFVLDLKGGSADPYALLEHAHREMARLDPQLNAFITIDGSVPEDLERECRNRVLCGVPVAVKDNIVTESLRTTCASLMLKDYVPSYSATVVERIVGAGGKIVGKTNLDEFAMGSLGTTSAFGPARNPLNLEWSPGGSSSGSAAAVASGMVFLALGSDTGGSIRLPAAWTGIFGLKPSYGLVSRYGLISYGESLEQIGPMASSARDLALLLSVIMGFDEKDSTSLREHIARDRVESIAFTNPKPETLSGLKATVIKELVEHPDSDEVMIREFWRALDRLSSEGLSYEVVSLPVVLKAPQTYYVIAFSEASSNLARYCGVLYGTRRLDFEEASWEEVYSTNRGLFGWEVKRRIILGSFVLSKGYYDMFFSKALKARGLIKRELDRLLSRSHLILTPGSPVKPLPLDYDITDLSKLNAVDAPLVLANLSGLPAITFPVGWTGRIPIALHAIGRFLSDDMLIELAKALTEEIFRVKLPFEVM